MNDYRIGNLVNDNYMVIEIDANGLGLVDANLPDDLASYIYLEYKSITPIPLTEKWLLKFEFEILLNDREIVLYRLNSADVSVHAKGGFTFGIRGVPLYKITYIHELQNSYYEFKKQILTCTHDQ